MKTPRIKVENTNNDTERAIEEFIKLCREDGFVEELRGRRNFTDNYTKRKLKHKKNVQNKAKDLDRARRKFKHKIAK